MKYNIQAGKAKPFLKPIILDEILELHKKHVKEMIRKESQKPITHAKLYDRYKALITKQVGQGALHLIWVGLGVHGFFVDPECFSNINRAI